MCKMNKKQKTDGLEHSSSEDEDVSGDEASDVDSEGNYIGDKQIEAMFEGRIPEETDFHGIKNLLRQLFLKADVDISELTQLIISQNYIGSVVKQSWDDDVEMDEEDDYADALEGVFGLTTLINLTTKKNENCIKQIWALLAKLAEENADAKSKTFISEMMNDESNNVGLIINERIMNIPAAISVPLFDSLQKEIARAVKKNMPYKFKYLIWISKTFLDNTEGIADSLYVNSEEACLERECVCSFQVDVSGQVDASQYEDNGVDMKPHRTIFVLEAHKLPEIIRSIEDHANEMKANSDH